MFNLANIASCSSQVQVELTEVSTEGVNSANRLLRLKGDVNAEIDTLVSFTNRQASALNSQKRVKLSAA